jgi:hypothetical protein
MICNAKNSRKILNPNKRYLILFESSRYWYLSQSFLDLFIRETGVPIVGIGSTPLPSTIDLANFYRQILVVERN